MTETALGILASDTVEYVADCVARNARSSLTTMEALTNHSSQRVRSTLAGATHTPPSILEILAEDEDMYVRQRAARHSNIQLRALERLSTDESPFVRSGVAGHANASSELLSTLSWDPDPKVRVRTVSERLKYDDLNRLFDDDDEQVRDKARQMLRKVDAKLKEQLQSASTPIRSLLVKLSRSNLPDSRRFVARHEETSSELLVVLSQDERKEVRRSVVVRANAPVAALLLLARDSENGIRQNLAIVHHANTRIMRILAHDPDPYIRGLVAVNADDVGVRLAMANDPDWRVRRGLLMNRAVPIEIVRALNDDENLEIRSIAAEWLMNTPADGWPRNGVGPQPMIELPSRSGE